MLELPRDPYRRVASKERAAVQAALLRLIKDCVWNVRRDVIKGLTYAGDWAIPVLGLAKNDPDTQLRREVSDAVRQINSRCSHE